jgi:hypothetical protein
MIPGNPVEAVISSKAGAIPPQAADSLYAQFGINVHEGACWLLASDAGAPPQAAAAPGAPMT